MTHPAAPPQLVFIHHPKTGGMSLHTAITNALPPAATLRIGDAAEHAAFLRMGRPALRDRRFISGHIGLEEALVRAQPHARFVTVMRDPIARILSSFNYMATWADHPLHATFRDLTFGEYVHSAGENLQSQACRQLTGVARAEDAIPILEACYALVATTEHVAKLTPIMAGWLGIPEPGMTRENVSPGQGRVTLDTATCEVLLEVTREDRALYEHVAGKYEGLMRHPAMR
jgi:hypothetical protein